MEQMQIDDLGDALYLAMRERRMLSPLTETYPELTIEDAYAISLRLLANRLQAGVKLIGKKNRRDQRRRHGHAGSSAARFRLYDGCDAPR